MAYDVVNPPGGMSYAPPMINFSTIGNLANTYYQGRQNRRQDDIATAFQGGMPIDPATGQPDYGKIMQVLAQKGDINAIGTLAAPQLQASLRAQAGQISPLLGGSPAGAQSPVMAPGVPQQASPISVQSIPAPPPGPLNAGDARGSVMDIVGAKLPQDAAATGTVGLNIARAVGVDPNAPLTPAQSARVTQLADAYVRRRPQSSAPVAAPVAPAAGSPNARVAAAFGGIPPTDAGASAPPPVNVAPESVDPRAVAQPAPAAPQEGAHPIIPQVPLPPGFKDPQQAVMALRREAARLASNPYAAGQVKLLEDWAARIENSMQPIKIGQAETIMDPRTGRVLAQGPAAAAFAHGGAPSQTLDADAERYRQTGTLPPNMGRGIQGQAEAQAIRTRAAELELAQGGNPNTWPSRWQEYRATGIGLNAGTRVRATREENLNLILKVTQAAIPAALQLSDQVARTGWVPINQIIQKGQVVASNPLLKRFGIANIQLAEAWARAMNPTGVMRDADRDIALRFLSTADSAETYRAAVMQIQTQIQRERDSIHEGGAPAQAPGSSAASAPAPAAPAADWVTLPNGIRYRPIGAK